MSSNKILNELIIGNNLTKTNKLFYTLIVRLLNRTNKILNEIFLYKIRRENIIFCKYLMMNKLNIKNNKIKIVNKCQKELKLIQWLQNQITSENVCQDLLQTNSKSSNDDILILYWRSISSSNLIEKSNTKLAPLNHLLINNHCEFPKLEKLYRMDHRQLII
ncbi:unnamed protein product [Rotaria socialis]|uniref:Uncharacterized protein n=1 Tax=Rotaria socialis TaxID=392032 RepID=A0A820G9F8_9BILA|nr:unnamed protein product [Rotaria socialis]CAF3405033.1 unnamed protein product [Rotaria socialis]CAF3598530.1 unnamed protein product [Rotaria socialis]CAF3681773.1 unnamed protein product [Rotaria socialis]CAF4129886.1 unnamed protein product [Rotaria socialis]